MNRVVLVIIVVASCSISACGQQNWSKWTTENHLTGGTILSIRYNAPPDSGEVHLAFVMPGSSYCYSGYQVKDKFPPLKDFDIMVKWNECGGSLDAITDSTKLKYKGDEKVILFNDLSYPARVGDVYVIMDSKEGESNIHRIKSIVDIRELPSDTEESLKNFLVNNLGWTTE